MNERTHTMTHLLFRAALFSAVLIFGLMATVARAQQISNKPLIDITGYVDRRNGDSRHASAARDGQGELYRAGRAAGGDLRAALRAEGVESDWMRTAIR